MLFLFAVSDAFTFKSPLQSLSLIKPSKSSLAFLPPLLLLPSVALADPPISPLEVADLPSPVVPIVFSVFLLISIGILTGSLGDIVAEEALLGDRSGARAKKEQERNRSSYFKEGGKKE